MADSTESNTNVQYLGLLVSALIAFIFGLVIHSFIIGVNINDWWKGRSVTSVDLIVTSLGISRICAQCLNILFLFVYTIFRSSLDSHVTVVIIREVYAFFIYANIWLTTLLSVLFCLKISNFHTRLFLYLRRMIVHRTVYFIVASVLLSIANCAVPLSAITEVTRGVKYNTTMANISTECIYNVFIYNFTIGTLFPLIFFYISSVLLFTSLYRHTAKMKLSSNLTINLETYYSAMKFLSVTFIYNTIYFSCHFFGILYYYFYCVNILWFYIVLDFLPVLHSSYLIYRTARLRNQMSKVLQNVIDFLFQRKGTETREDIEIVAQYSK